MAVDWNSIRRRAFALPGVEERTSHGTPALFVGSKQLGRLQDDGETMSLFVLRADRDDLVDRYPDVFSVPPHFENYDYVLLNLLSANEGLVVRQLEVAWRIKAPKRAVAEFDADPTH